MATRDTLRVNSRSISGDELLSYIINVTPELQGQVELPVQGDKNNIPRIGEIISSNNRFKNAFINTVNLIALTVIDRNGWENPWDFTTRGTMAWGDSVREMMLDLVDPHDYNDDLEDEELDSDIEKLTDLDDTLELDVNEVKRVSDEYE